MSNKVITVPYHLNKEAYPIVRIGLAGTRINDELAILPQEILVEIDPDLWASVEDLVDAYKLRHRV